MKTTLLFFLIAGSIAFSGCVHLPPEVESRLSSAKQKFSTITCEMSQVEVLERLGPPMTKEGNTFTWRENGPGMNFEKLSVTFTADGRTRSLGTAGVRFIRAAPGVSATVGGTKEILTDRKD